MNFRFSLILGLALAVVGFVQPPVQAQSVQQQKLTEAAKSSSVGSTKFEAAAQNFSMQAPSSWQIEKVDLPYIFKGKILNGVVNVNVVVEDVGELMSRQKYAQLVLDNVRQDGRLKILNFTDGEIRVNGLKALHRQQSAKINDINISQEVVILVENSKAYTFTASTLPEAAKMFHPIFEKMYASIKLGGK